MAGNTGEITDYDTNGSVSGYERRRNALRRAGAIGSRVLDVYAYAQAAVHIGLSALALTGTLYATASPDVDHFASNTSRTSTSIGVSNGEATDSGSSDLPTIVTNENVEVAENTISPVLPNTAG